MVAGQPGAKRRLIGSASEQVANDALVLSLEQLPGYFRDAASIVSNGPLARIAVACNEMLSSRMPIEFAMD